VVCTETADSEGGMWPLDALASSGDLVRALLADTAADTPVEETVYKGRPAWKATLRLTLPPGPEDEGTTHTVTESLVVDQETHLVMSMSLDGDDGTLWEIRLSNLRVDEPVERSLFTIGFPQGRQVHTTYAYSPSRYCSAAEAGIALGRPLLQPRWAPAGYGLADTLLYNSAAYETEIVTEGPWGNVTREVPSVPADYGKIAKTSLRRGFDTIGVITALMADATPGELDWDTTAFPTAQRTKLRGGYFSGREATTVFDLVPGQPTLFVTDGTIGVTVNGAVSRSELIQIAESLYEVGK
jgi:hypothetical protein